MLSCNNKPGEVLNSLDLLSQGKRQRARGEKSTSSGGRKWKWATAWNFVKHLNEIFHWKVTELSFDGEIEIFIKRGNEMTYVVAVDQ